MTLSRKILFVAAPIVAAPCVFVVVFWMWVRWDAYQSNREVSAFIADRVEWGVTRRRDPAVHGLELAHDSDEPASLRITIDVDDKRTYESIESELKEAWALRRAPRWVATIRSGEELHDIPGVGAGAGMSALGDVIRASLIALVAALAASLLLQVQVLKWIRRQPASPRSATT